MYRRTFLAVLLTLTMLVPFAADAQKPIKVGFPMIMSLSLIHI